MSDQGLNSFRFEDIDSTHYSFNKGQFVCPECHGNLQIDQDTTSLVCSKCAARWPVKGNIPCFLSDSALPEYSLAGGMSELVRLARNEGWLSALELHLDDHGRRKEYVREYVASEARADFRFLMSVDKNATILDVGSGWGNISVAFARRSDLVYALDTTLSNLQFVEIRARQEGLNNVLPLLGDAVCLPQPSHSCDAVLMVGVLEWIPWGRSDGKPKELQLKALSEAFRTLKPGGQLYLGIENRFGFKYFLGFPEPHTGLRFASLLPRSLADLYSRKVRDAPFREWTYSEHELTDMLHQVGFGMVKCYYPIPSYQNFRYITDYGNRAVGHFLIGNFRGHGRFVNGLRLAGRLASALRLERKLSPCFSIIATKL